MCVTDWRAVKIDPEDAWLLDAYSWFLVGNGYPAHCKKIPGTRKSRWYYLHRELLGVTERHVHVDHINGDKLDNRRINLRLADASKNMMNVSKPQGKNPHRGITWLKNVGRWRANIHVRGQTIGLGSYTDLQDAIAARVAAERTYFGEFAPKRVAV